MCYSLNRHLQAPIHFHLTSFNAEMAVRFAPDIQKWDVHRHMESAFEIFNKDDIVYLSPDSDTLLDTIDDSKIYVIGGIIDHTVEKNISLDCANNANVQTARLPIKENLPLFKNSCVLTVNQVFKILLDRFHDKSWTDVFEENIPKRKFRDSEF
ncbi:MAG: tRNA methyltransferase 10 [Paramarteilia canceri]